MKKFLLLLLSNITMLTLAFAQQAGKIDTTFNSGDMGFGWGFGANGTIYATSLQSDGKIIIGGDFTSYNGMTRNHIARLNIDGSIDYTFDPMYGAYNFPDCNISAINIQSDGKIIIGGKFTSFKGVTRNYIARLNADGSLDETFDPGSGANNDVKTISIQSDGKIIVGGYFSSYNGVARKCIARLNTEGSLDNTFDPGTGASTNVLATGIQSDGKIIVGGNLTSFNGITCNNLVRLNPDGSVDNTFNSGSGANSYIVTMDIQSDGKIIIGGYFSSYNGVAIENIARLNEDGTLDPAFNPGTGYNTTVLTAKIKNDGKIVVGGIKYTSSSGAIRVLETDGSLSASFNSGIGPNRGVYATCCQSDGKIIVGGFFTSYNRLGGNHIIRFNANGSLDATFNPGTGANDIIYTTNLQSDGKIIIGGSFSSYNGVTRNLIARLNTDGSLDTAFNSGTDANYFVRSSCIQTDGKIIIGGNFRSYDGVTRRCIARLNNDGSLDTTFNPGTGIDPNSAYSNVYSINIQADGKIIIGGHFSKYNDISRRNIARLNADGSLDNSFNPGSGPNDIYTGGVIYSMDFQNDGKIIIGGGFTKYSGTPINCIARLNANGSLDNTFNIGSGIDPYPGTVETINIQPDGKIIVGGHNFKKYNGISCKDIIRLNPNGSLDNTFGAEPNSGVSVSCIQTDGKIIIGGGFAFFNGVARKSIVRLNVDGSLDNTFNPGTGANGMVNTISIQNDGNIILGGDFTSYNETGRNCITRCIGKSCVALSPIISSNGPVAFCNGSSAILSSTAANSYLWSNGATTNNITVTESGNYFVAIDSAGCTGSSVTLTVTVNSLPSISISSTTTICAGSSTTLSGSGADTYLWTSGPATETNVVSPLTATTYTLTGTITATGCTNTSSQLITVNALPAVSISFFSNISCFEGNDGVIMLNSVGGLAPYSYSWFPTGGSSTSASNLVQGTYSISISDKNACKNTISQTITQPATALSVNVSGTDASCSGCIDGSASATASGGTSPYSFSWSGLQTTAAIIGLTAKEYTVCVMDAEGCGTCKSYVVSEPTGISSFISDHGIKIYPNPSDNFNIELKDSSKALPYEITDVFGRAIIRGFLSNKITLLNLSAFDAGVYMLRVNDKVLRLIKN